MKNYDFNKADDVIRYARENLKPQTARTTGFSSTELQENIIDRLEWAKKEGLDEKYILERASVPNNIKKLLTQKNIDLNTDENNKLKKTLLDAYHMIDAAMYSCFAEKHRMKKQYIFCGLSGCPSALEKQPDMKEQERIKQQTGHYDLSKCEWCKKFDKCDIWHTAVENLTARPDKFRKAYGTTGEETAGKPSPTPTPETKRTITAKEVNDFIKSKGTVSPEELAEFLAMYDIITTKK